MKYYNASFFKKEPQVRSKYLACFLLIFYGNVYAQKSVVPANWQSVNTGVFSINLPPDWSTQVTRGRGVYYGYFKGDNIVLKFELSFLTVPSQRYVSSKYVILYETVGGKSAQIVFPRPKVDRELTAVYFPNIYGAKGHEPSFGFTVLTPQQLSKSQRNLVLKIFRSIKLNTESKL